MGDGVGREERAGRGVELPPPSASCAHARGGSDTPSGSHVRERCALARREGGGARGQRACVHPGPNLALPRSWEVVRSALGSREQSCGAMSAGAVSFSGATGAACRVSSC